MPFRPRPIGVTILAILQIMAGIVDIIIGLLLAFVYAVAAVIFGVGMHGFTFLVLPWSILFFVLGIFSFILAYGLWTGQGWAWTFSVILALISLGICLIGLFFADWAEIVPIVFYTLILVYLMSYHVRAFFGRAPAFPTPFPTYAPPNLPYPPQPAPQYQQPPYNQPPPMQPQWSSGPPRLLQRGSSPLRRTDMCPICLSPIEIGSPYCPRCGSRLR